MTLMMPYSNAVWEIDVIGEHSDLHHHPTPLPAHANYLFGTGHQFEMLPGQTGELPPNFDGPNKKISHVNRMNGFAHLHPSFKPPKV